MKAPAAGAVSPVTGATFRAWTPRVLLAAICLLPIILYVPVLNEPFHSDEGTFATIAQRMLAGDLPYRDAFNINPPALYGWYALSFAAFGDHVWAPRLLASLFLSLTAFLIYLEGRLLFSRRGAYVAALAFALSTGISSFWPSAQPENFMLLPMVGALVAFTLGWQKGDQRWYLLAGGLSAIAVLTRQTAVLNLFVLLAFAALLALKHPASAIGRWRPLAILALSTGVLIALAIMPFILLGASGDLIYAHVEYPWLYSHSLTWTERISKARDALAWVPKAAGPWLILSLIGSVRLFRGRKDGSMMLVAWSAASVVGTVSTWRFSPYYFTQLLPAMALLTPVGIAALWPVPTHIRDRALVYIATALIVLAAIAAIARAWPAYAQTSAQARHAAKYGMWGEIENQSPQLAAYIQERTSPGEPIYVLGYEDEIYFYSSRRPALRWLHSASLWIDPAVVADTLSRLAESQPKYIIDSAWPLHLQGEPSIHYPLELQAFLGTQYDYAGRVYYADIWRLKEESQEGTPGVQ